MLMLHDRPRPRRASATRREVAEADTSGLRSRTYQVTDRGTGETINLFARESVRSGRTLVFLHGLSSHAFIWDSVQSDLIRSFATIAIDQRGHGRSGGTPAHGYGAPDFAGDVAAIIRQQPGPRRPVTLVGHSLGARNALAAAALFPDLVDSVCVLDWSPFVADATIATIQAWAASYPASHASRPAVAAFLADQYPLLSETALSTRLDYGFEGNADGWRPLARRTCLTRAAEGLSFDLRPFMSSLRRSALFVRGTRSHVVDERTWRQTQAFWPKHRYVELDADHQLPEVRPAEVADQLFAFLKEGERR